MEDRRTWASDEHAGAAGGEGAAETPPWREEALRRMLRMAAVVGPVALVAGLALRGVWRTDAFLFVASGCMAIQVTLVFVNRLPFVPTAWLSILVFYVPGLFLIAGFGLFPGPALVIASSMVLAAVYFGRRSAAFALLAVAVATYLVIGWLVSTGRLAGPIYEEGTPRTFKNWLRVAAVFTLMSGFLALAVRDLVGRLEWHYGAASAALQQIRGSEARWQRYAEQLIALGRNEAIESGDIGAAFRAICEAGAATLAVERSSVWLLEEPGGELRCVNLFERTAERHGPGPTLDPARYPEYFAAIRRERTLAVNVAALDPRTAELAAGYLRPLGVTSLLDAPIRHQDRVVGVVCQEHVGRSPGAWSPEAQSFAGSMADFAARALAAADRAARSRDLSTAYQQLGQLHRRLESAKEEERRHIAHELHDELGQSLTALKLRFQMLARRRQADGGRGGGDAGAAVESGEITRQSAGAVALVDSLIDRVRRMSLDLRPPLLDEVGLVPALRAYIESQAGHSGVTMALETADLEARRLAPEIEMACFRIVQEAVTNVLRHAAASRVAVTLSASGPGGAIEIVVGDDGQGFVPEETLERAAAGGHLGLVGMRERARALGGQFGITSRPGAGSSVRVTLPVPRTAA